jgi:putative membrane protein insertion efficiency factor
MGDLRKHLGLLPRRFAHYAIRAYQLSLSIVFGRQCRYLPSCSAYMDEAVLRHGLWAGSNMGLARLCRCHPWGGQGFDPVPAQLPAGASWLAPWRYGDWQGPTRCEDVQPAKR